MLQDYGSSDGELEQSGVKAGNSDPYQGRIRNFPHVEGSYATHVYVTVHLPEQARTSLACLVKQVALPLHALASSPKEGLHLSLSRTVAIRHLQISELVAKLKRALLRTERFIMSFQGWEAFVNDDGTRTFLAVPVSQGHAQVCRSIQQVNKAFTLFDLQCFYEDPRPHVSVAWTLGSHAASLMQHVQHSTAAAPAAWTMQLEKIECKIGQNTYILWS